MKSIPTHYGICFTPAELQIIPKTWKVTRYEFNKLISSYTICAPLHISCILCFVLFNWWDNFVTRTYRLIHTYWSGLTDRLRYVHTKCIVMWRNYNNKNWSKYKITFSFGRIHQFKRQFFNGEVQLGKKIKKKINK